MEEINYITYRGEQHLLLLSELIARDLSEPYSVYTYRYFLNNWPQFCFLAMKENDCVGVIICKLDMHRHANRGYIAMLAVDKSCRHRGIGTTLVKKAIEAMKEENCEEVVLETELKNVGAMALYENLGFTRDKRLYRYYLNGGDAFRLKLWLK